MIVEGICTSDNEISITTKEEYYRRLKDYINGFNISEEEMKIRHSTQNLGKYYAEFILHLPDPDLCTFGLFHIILNNLKPKSASQFEADFALKSAGQNV